MPSPELIGALRKQIIQLDKDIAAAEIELELAKKAKIETPQLGNNLQRLKERVGLIKATYGI